VVGVRLDRRWEERRGARGTTAHWPGTGRDVGQQMYQRGRRRAGGSPAPLRPPRAFDDHQVVKRLGLKPWSGHLESTR
jgi:hypothetical protein